MKMKVGMRISGVGILTIAIFLFVCIVLFSAMGKLSENQSWVTHTYKVISEAEDLLALMVDQETGMRGFLVTGNDVYLEPYDNGKAQFYSSIEELMATVNDNPVQVDRLKKIKSSALSWDSEAASRFIEIRRGIVK